MEGENCEMRYCGDRISSVKIVSTDCDDMQMFVTGTYDRRFNCLATWSVGEKSVVDGSKIPHLLTTVTHQDEVNKLDIHYQNGILASASSGGGVYVYQLDRGTGAIQLEQAWPALHHLKSGKTTPCTDVSVGDSRCIASCGEDGTINILDIHRSDPVKMLVGCDSSVLTSVLWVSPKCVAAVNTSGQLKVYDIRQSGCQAVQTFLLSRELSILTCMDKHPSQNHLIATGGVDGILNIYDLRQEGVPVTIMEGHHGSTINDIKFHPQSPESLYTAAANGTIWHWNGDKENRVAVEGGSCWFLAEVAKRRIDVKELYNMETETPYTHNLEVNSLDIQADTMVAGTDSGAVCFFHQI